MSRNVKTNSSQILHSGGKWSFRTLDVKLYRTRCKIGELGDWGGGGRVRCRTDKICWTDGEMNCQENV